MCPDTPYFSISVTTKFLLFSPQIHKILLADLDLLYAGKYKSQLEFIRLIILVSKRAAAGSVNISLPRSGLNSTDRCFHLDSQSHSDCWTEQVFIIRQCKTHKMHSQLAQLCPSSVERTTVYNLLRTHLVLVRRGESFFFKSTFTNPTWIVQL